MLTPYRMRGSDLSSPGTVSSCSRLSRIVTRFGNGESTCTQLCHFRRRVGVAYDLKHSRSASGLLSTSMHGRASVVLTLESDRPPLLCLYSRLACFRHGRAMQDRGSLPSSSRSECGGSSNRARVRLVPLAYHSWTFWKLYKSPSAACSRSYYHRHTHNASKLTQPALRHTVLGRPYPSRGRIVQAPPRAAPGAAHGPPGAPAAQGRRPRLGYGLGVLMGRVDCGECARGGEPPLHTAASPRA